MSYDPCPKCHGITEFKDQLCSKCNPPRNKQTDDLVESIMQSARVGTDLYHRAISECRPEHRKLMEEVWLPTPWMLNVFTDGRDQEIWQWCYRHFGVESSPIHRKEGTWKRGNVTMRGYTWFGFKSKMMLDLFEAQFPSTSHGHH